MPINNYNELFYFLASKWKKNNIEKHALVECNFIELENVCMLVFLHVCVELVQG